MKKLFWCLLLMGLTGCLAEIPREEYKQSHRVVADKKETLHYGVTRFTIAFEDGSSENFSFGIYTKYNVGDIVCMESKRGWVWYIKTECTHNKNEKTWVN